MKVLDFILDGLEKALELERELGVRSVEIDRKLVGEAGAVRERPTEGGAMRSIAEAPKEVLSARSQLVFLHDRPLSEKGVEMMAKIIQALGFTADTAPIVICPPIPDAKIYVFLGFTALRKYMPTLKIAENTWGKSPKGKDILVVKSPEEILRFASVTPAVQKMKEAMWRSLKAVVQRLG